jgi:hypothetical protein
MANISGIQLKKSPFGSNSANSVETDAADPQASMTAARPLSTESS